jgi:hypothetical protein
MVMLCYYVKVMFAEILSYLQQNIHLLLKTRF